MFYKFKQFLNIWILIMDCQKTACKQYCGMLKDFFGSALPMDWINMMDKRFPFIRIILLNLTLYHKTPLSVLTS